MPVSFAPTIPVEIRLPAGVLLALLLGACASEAPVAPRTAVEAPPLTSLAPGPREERTFHIIPERTTVSYHAQEKYLAWPAPTKAVASTSNVEGQFVLITGDQPALAANHFRVDLGTLRTETDDRPASLGGPPVFQRDEVVAGMLTARGRFPFAQFTATGAERLPFQWPENQVIKLRLSGDLTIRGVARTVVFETEARLQGATLSGTATADILMTDFSVTPPDVLGVVKVEDQLTISIRFTAEALP